MVRGKIFEGFTGGMAGSKMMGGMLDGLRREIEARIRQEVERLAKRLDLVTRAEFEAVEAIAIAAREQAEDLAEQLAGEKLRRAAPKAAAHKPAAKKATKPAPKAKKSTKTAAKTRRR